MSVSGKWNITIKAPTGPQHTVLELKEAGGKLTGAQTGQGVTTEISDGTCDGTAISWINHVTRPIRIKVTFTGTVEGKTMSGKAKAGFIGSYAFTGTKA